MIISLPTIMGVYLILSKILELSGQAMELFDTETDVDLVIDVSREALSSILYEDYLELFFEQAFSEGLLFYKPDDTAIHTRPSTFNTEAVIRIFEHYLDPVEKINVLLDLSSYLVYPIIEAYWKDTGIQGTTSRYSWTIFIEAMGYLVEFFNLLK